MDDQKSAEKAQVEARRAPNALIDDELCPREVTGELTVNQVRAQLNQLQELVPELLESVGREFLLRWAELQQI